MAEGRIVRFEVGEEFNSTLLGGGHMESTTQNSAASSPKSNPWLTDKEPVTSVLQQQGVELDQQLE